MVFDGLRALLVGDYVTPSSGAYAGQLGPWAVLVRRLGIEPRSMPMKLCFVVLGAAGLVATGAYAGHAPWGWAAMLVTAATTLWYLPVGTATALVQILLLVLSSATKLQ